MGGGELDRNPSRESQKLSLNVQTWLQDADWDELVHRWIDELRLPGDPPILRLSPRFADEVTYLLSLFQPNLARFLVSEMVRIHRQRGGGELRLWKKIRFF